MDAALFGRSTCRSYRRLIESFLELGLVSRPLREIAERETFAGSVGIRHDVDHHLERALLMGLIEHELGVRASYYLLPPGDYNLSENYYGRLSCDRVDHNPALGYAAHFLVALGHEVGLHNNFVQLAYQLRRSIEELLSEELNFFRTQGVVISGTASHGSIFARRHNFANYEIFTSSARSSGGGLQERGGRVIREGSFSCQLNTIDMALFGLSYEAYSLGRALYFSDVGSRVTMSWTGAEGGRLETLAIVDNHAGELARASGEAGMHVLVHADHWTFTTDGEGGEEARRRIKNFRRERGRMPPTRPPLLSLSYLDQLLAELRSQPQMRFINYDHLAVSENPSMHPAERNAAEGRAWADKIACDESEPNATYLLIHYNADDNPDAVDAVASLHRKHGVPYSLLTFARWRSPSAGIVEPYPLEWDDLQHDASTGLACIGYLNNALHLSNGDVEAAVTDFDMDIAHLRSMGFRCPVFMPWGAAMPSPEMPRPVFVDWWKLASETPLWVYNRFGIGWDSYYVDTLLAAGRDVPDPATWLRNATAPKSRRLLLLHPRHYFGE